MKLTVYSSNGCMACKLTKDLLDREGLAFTEKNISDNETFRNEVEVLGFKRVPITKVEDNTGSLLMSISGFNPEALQALNGIKEGLE